MRSYMKQGWRIAVKHMYVIVLLFLYQLIWGFFLYRYVESAVTPLLRRWPAAAPNDYAVSIFLSEAQFQLVKTSLATPYLWLLGGLLAARMLLTPLFNAGLLYSIHHARDDGGTRFFEGIHRSWRTVGLLYLAQMALTAAPALWLAPKAAQAFRSSGSIAEIASQLAPGAAGWLLWSVALHLLSLAMQFGVVSGAGAFQALGTALRRLLPYAALTVAMWGISLMTGLLATFVSLLWVGLFALILHQGYSFIRTLLKVWTLAAQYESLHPQPVQS
ncbi:hypothetical protein ACFSL6_23850 [Paenibacillus thailandensis]|uniref:DUF4013 domain-containing protein n=1 Tax=Paenibacillus thailandensis TaxID=393250 RepID=A0ABW5R1Y1_9BACL